MKRYLDDLVVADLERKLVVLTGPRQVGKTTLARQVMARLPPAQYLNWDVPSDRAVLQRQSWSPAARLLAMDEIHKMAGWKSWLKGVVDGRPEGQALLVTGSARMETFRQGGESLAGRYFALRLHPISVREWCEQQDTTPTAALQHLIERGGFPEPCLAEDPVQADRWRAQYLTDLVREDVLEFSRVQEVGAMRLFVEMLRERVGSPLSLASIARDLAVAPATLRRYLDILQALFIVFTVQPWHERCCKLPKSIFSTLAWCAATLDCAWRTPWQACCSSSSNSWLIRRARTRACTTSAPKMAPRSTLRCRATAR